MSGCRAFRRSDHPLVVATIHDLGTGARTSMGRRSRRRARGDEGDTPASTSDYTDTEGNVLTLRDELSAGTIRRIQTEGSKPAASAEDLSQRRTELLFERLAVRWVISELPLEGQRELLGRLRMASADERRWVRETLDEHLGTHLPELR